MDQYDIVDKINKGSFGVVYSTRDKKNEEMVTVKEEVHGLSSSTLMEIKILKFFLPAHPNIVEFKQLVMEGGHVFVVMELLKYDLKRLRVAKGRPFSLA